LGCWLCLRSDHASVTDLKKPLFEVAFLLDIAGFRMGVVT